MKMSVEEWRRLHNLPARGEQEVVDAAELPALLEEQEQRKQQVSGQRSEYEEQFAYQLRVVGIPFKKEQLFHPERDWRLDFVFPDAEKLAAEIDGGNRMVRWSEKQGRYVAVGRHTQADDYEKLNEAMLLGWRVLRFVPAQVESGAALEWVERALKKKASLTSEA